MTEPTNIITYDTKKDRWNIQMPYKVKMLRQEFPRVSLLLSFWIDCKHHYNNNIIANIIVIII